MNTLVDHLIAARVEALEAWQTDHAQAMASHDLDDSLGEIVKLWREICDVLDQAPASRREQHKESLAEEEIFARLLGVTERFRQVASEIGYFERGFRFSSKFVDGLLAGLRRAVDTGLPSQRMQLTLDLTNLPPRMPTPE